MVPPAPCGIVRIGHLSGTRDEIARSGFLPIVPRREPFTQESVGRGVARWLETTTSDALSVEEGSLYPALRRPMDRGWVRAEWAISQNNRRARYYTLTERGRAQLEREVSEWERFSGVGREVLDVHE